MKKIYILIIVIISFNFCFSQNTEIKIEGDSIIKVNPNSIFANNYYLVCSSGENSNNLRHNSNEQNLIINSNLIWKKVQLTREFGGNMWIPKFNNGEIADLQLTWDDIDWNNIKINPNESFTCDRIKNIPNGKYEYKTQIEKSNGKLSTIIITGSFNNGLANGSWEKYITQNKENEPKNCHFHQNFINGIPHGEWYTEIDGKKTNICKFNFGKADGLWIQIRLDQKSGAELSKSEIEYKNGLKNGNYRVYSHGYLMISCSFSDGLLNGEYLTYSLDRSNQKTFLKEKRAYSNGKPIGLWEFYGENEASVSQVKYIDSSKIILIEKLGSKTIEEIYLQEKDTAERGNCLNFSDFFLPKDFSCNRKTTTFYNGKVKRIEYFGTEKYKMGKKFIEYYNYENDKIKFEGIYGQNITFFDNQGNLINKTNFDSKTIYYEQDEYDTQRTNIKFQD